MTTWGDFERAEPDLARRVRELFEAGRHKTIATIRADGSPRISGIECEFADGELTFGSMPRSRKLADLERDPRFALHGPTFHPEVGRESEWTGEAKVAGLAIAAGPIEVEPDADAPDADDAEAGSGAPTDAAEPPGYLFTADIGEVVVTGLNDEATMLVVEWWTPEGGRRRVERE